jgi:hypothetical protein
MFLCRIWRFTLYWWWFIGLAFLFLVGVATTVLPLPTGKPGFALPCLSAQLCKAAETCRKPAHTAYCPLLLECLPAGWVVRKQMARALRQEGAVLEAIVRLMAAEDPLNADVTCNIHRSSGSSSDSGGGSSERDFPAASSGRQGGAAAAGRAKLAAAAAWLGGGRRALSRLSSRGGASRRDLQAAAQGMGIHSDMQAAVEPIYAMAGPATDSIQAS